MLGAGARGEEAPGSSLKGFLQFWPESIRPRLAASHSNNSRWRRWSLWRALTYPNYHPTSRVLGPPAMTGCGIRGQRREGPRVPLLLRPQGFDSTPLRLLGHKRNRKGRSCFVAGC